MSFLDRLAGPQLSSDQKIARARHATALVRDEVLQSALDEAETEWLARWFGTNDPAIHAKCHAAILALGELRRTLDKFVDDGVLEESRRDR